MCQRKLGCRSIETKEFMTFYKRVLLFLKFVQSVEYSYTFLLKKDGMCQRKLGCRSIETKEFRHKK